MSSAEPALLQSLLELARAVAGHPASLVAAGEGFCAAREPGGMLFLTRPASLSAGVGREAVEGLDVAALRAAAELEGVTPGALEAEGMLFAELMEGAEVGFGAHVQPVEVNQILASPRARQFAERRVLPHEAAFFGGGAVLAGYASPGGALAREVRKKVMLWKDRHRAVPRLVLLQNNGMVVMGRSPAEVMAVVEGVLRAARVFVGASLLGGPLFLAPGGLNHVGGGAPGA